MFKINYAGVMAEMIGVENGLTKNELRFFKDQFESLSDNFLGEKREYGFVKILKDKGIVEESKKFYKEKKGFKNIVVLGIGGSALGLNAILNLYSFKDKDKNFYILDNIDPYLLSNVFGKIDISKTLFFVISKSGETVETLSQFLFAYDLVQKKGLNVKEHFVFTTDPEKGFLREIAKKEGIIAFDVPPELGGRFSVLSFVGMLPAYFIDEDIGDLMKGAKLIDKKNEEVFLFSHLLYLLNIRRGKSNVVIFPYCERLEKFAQWFSQLWAESLGKKLGNNNEILRTGQTPIVAKGVTDQHSQLQLYLEGPRDKVVIMLKSKEKVDINIPNVFRDYDSVNYLCNKSFDELFNAEYLGTYGALIKESIPTIRLEVEELNLKTLGALFYFFELATAYSGKLYNINPFNQPGVEIGKKIAFSLLGKKGYKEDVGEKVSGLGEYELSLH